MLLQAITFFYTSVLTFLTVGLSQVLSDTLHHIDHGTTCFLFRAAILLCVRGSNHTLFLPSPDNVWYCRCLLIFTIVVRTDVMGSVLIKCALLSKLEPYCAPDPEADDWMRKAESCRLYELVPTPRLFVRPITAILGKPGKVAMLRAGDTGTVPFSMRGYERTYYPGGECDSAADKGDCSRLWYINTWAMKWLQTE
jgi:hypothetical protein